MAQSPAEVLQYNYLSSTVKERQEAADVILQGALNAEPPTQAQIDAVERVTRAFKNALVIILTELPPSAERTLVIRGIEDAKMRSVLAVFRTVE
jgi:hypothetical protein